MAGMPVVASVEHETYRNACQYPFGESVRSTRMGVSVLAQSCASLRVGSLPRRLKARLRRDTPRGDGPADASVADTGMQLTTSRLWAQRGAAQPRLPRTLAILGIMGIAAVVFVLDWTTGLSHVQHLYYAPIVLAAIRFGTQGGVAAAASAIMLYHLANSDPLSWRYEESDILQMAVFVAMGLVAARLADDARRLHQRRPTT